MSLQEMFRGSQLRRIVLGVLDTRHPDPHVRRWRVDADTGSRGHATLVQDACEAQHAREAANAILLFR